MNRAADDLFAPAKGRDLLARDTEAERLLRHVCGGGEPGVAALVGAPGIGRTSLLYRLASDLAARRAQGWRLAGLQLPAGVGIGIPELGARLARAAAAAFADLPERKEKSRATAALPDAGEPFARLEELLESAEGSGLRPVILIDPAEQLLEDESFDGDVAAVLRHLNGKRGLGLVLSLTRLPAESPLSRSAAQSALLVGCPFVVLAPLRALAAGELVKTVVEKLGSVVAPSERGVILEACGGHPAMLVRATQLFLEGRSHGQKPDELELIRRTAAAEGNRVRRLRASMTSDEAEMLEALGRGEAASTRMLARLASIGLATAGDGPDRPILPGFSSWIEAAGRGTDEKPTLGHGHLESTLRTPVAGTGGSEGTLTPSAGASPMALRSSVPKPGERIGDRYELRKELGVGGCGRVYLAFDTTLERDIALKVLHTPPNEDPVELRQRFRREALTVARLTHPSLVILYDQGDDQGLLYLVMELVSGGSLADQMSPGRIIPVSEVARYGAEIADGLAHAHNRGVIHRDIKPANILLTMENRVKISDFGIAHLAGKTTEKDLEEIVGTPLYMSPEQIRGEAVGPESDLFSLGVVLYQMLAGRPPFLAETLSGITMAILYAPIPSLPDNLAAGVPAEMQEIVARALSKDRRARWGSGEELAKALREVR